MAVENEGRWCRFRQPPTADHARRLPRARLLGELSERAPQVIRQRRTGVEHDVELGKETPAQLVVVAQLAQEQVEAARDVEINGGRDFPEIAEGARHLARGR